MHRIAPLLLIVGLLLLATSLRVPASPVVTGPVAPAPAFFDGQSAAVLAAVEAEAARLRQRLDEQPDPPVASRDPFRFGNVPETAVVAPAGEANLTAAEPPARMLVLPRIVAMTTTGAGDPSTRRAFVAFGGSVLEVGPGSDVGEFVVETIGVTVIELRHRDLGTTHVIRLR